MSNEVLHAVTIGDAIKELERDRYFRRRYYPRAVESGQMEEGTATLQLARLKGAIEMLKKIQSQLTNHPVTRLQTIAVQVSKSSYE